MHPLIPFGAAALIGAVVYAVASGGLKERYEKIAFAAGIGGGLIAGGVLLWMGGPAIPGYGKRFLATAGLGFSSVLLGCNLGLLAQCGSGGFSSARDGAFRGVFVFLLVVAFCAPHVRPA